MILISNQEEFNDLIKKLALQPILFMDTEFYRRTTYYANLCLIQISTKQEQFIIDTLAAIDIKPLADILADKKIIKVFHSCEQDIQILYEYLGVMPRNIFDTQIAASACGLGSSLSYQNLCYRLLDVNLDKAMQNTDWQTRPLSDRALEYAASDVLYLIQLHDRLSSIMKSKGLWKNYREQISNVISKDRIVTSPERIMNRIKDRDISNKQESYMIDLISFREACAKEINIPRKFFLTDKELLRIAKKLPTSIKELRNMGLNMQYLGKKDYANQLVDICIGLGEGE